MGAGYADLAGSAQAGSIDEPPEPKAPQGQAAARSAQRARGKPRLRMQPPALEAKLKMVGAARIELATPPV